MSKPIEYFNPNQEKGFCWVTGNVRPAHIRREVLSPVYREKRFKGVHFDKGKYRAFITYGGKCRFLGYFTTEEDAARQYNKIALEKLGASTFLNNVDPMFPVSEKPKHRSDSTTGFMGVSKNGKGGWRARLTHLGKVFFLGIYESKIDAAMAYDKKAIEIHGWRAKTNF